MLSKKICKKCGVIVVKRLNRFFLLLHIQNQKKEKRTTASSIVQCAIFFDKIKGIIQNKMNIIR
jgi:hypothetical protein